jgi:hypothetical protein
MDLLGSLQTPCGVGDHQLRNSDLRKVNSSAPPSPWAETAVVLTGNGLDGLGSFLIMGFLFAIKRYQFCASHTTSYFAAWSTAMLKNVYLNIAGPGGRAV